MIGGQLSDPRIGSASVTEVVLAPGGKSGHVYVAVHGDEAQEERTLEGLMAARGYIRSELLDRLGVRHLPELTFHIDRSEKYNNRMDTLLERMKKRAPRSRKAGGEPLS